MAQNALPAPLQAALGQLLRANALAIQRSQAHTRALLPSDTGDWNVDLEAARFTASFEEDVCVTSPAQLVATWSGGDGSWLWGDHNPSVAKAGSAELFSKLELSGTLRELRAIRTFAIDEPTAAELATWCALRAGYVGAWPAPNGTAFAFLALQPTVSVGPAQSITWCTMCGKSQLEVKVLLAGPDVNVCDACVELVTDIAGEEPPSSDAPHAEYMDPCLFCGEHRKRVFGPTGALCFGCANACQGMMKRE